MIVGVTGSRDGPTEAQKFSGAFLLGNCATIQLPEYDEITPNELHHGDCIGVDEWAHNLLTSYGFKTVAHPPENRRFRAFCKADECRITLPYLKRNRNIVEECDVLLAMPKTSAEVLRSGTWATVRHARKLGRPVVIVWPDGKATYDRWEWEKPIKERDNENAGIQRP